MAQDIHPFERAPTRANASPWSGRVRQVFLPHTALLCMATPSPVYERRPKAGGLNEYGIAAYKSAGNFAAREVDWLLKIGGITLQQGDLGNDLSLTLLAAEYDAVFLGIGLAGVNALGLPGEDLPHVRNAVDFIAELRQAADKSTFPVGRDVVVIGGGMTAVDAAVQTQAAWARRMSAWSTAVARTTMSASLYEQEHAHGRPRRAASSTTTAPQAIRSDAVHVRF